MVRPNADPAPGPCEVHVAALEHLRHEHGLPGARHHFGFCLGRILGGLDERDHLVDVVERDRQAFEYVRAVTRLAQVVDRATRYHFTPVTDKRLEQLLEVQQPRLAVNQRHGVDAEHTLHRGVLVEIVQDNVRHFAALEFDHHAHPGLVGFVAQLGDALDFFFLHQLGDLFEQVGLVHLVRQLGDDDGLTAVLLVSLDRGARAHVHPPAAGAISLADTLDAGDDRRGREIRPGMCRISASMSVSGLSMSARQALMTSFRLCGGMLVAIPTAMPEEPLTSRFGNLAGNTSGSCSEPS